jgi:hypothetical protein
LVPAFVIVTPVTTPPDETDETVRAGATVYVLQTSVTVSFTANPPPPLVTVAVCTVPRVSGALEIVACELSPVAPFRVFRFI